MCNTQGLIYFLLFILEYLLVMISYATLKIVFYISFSLLLGFSSS